MSVHDGVAITERDLASLLAMLRLVRVMLAGFLGASADADHDTMVGLLCTVADRLETECDRREAMAWAAAPYAPSLRAYVVDGIDMGREGWSPT